MQEQQHDSSKDSVHEDHACGGDSQAAPEIAAAGKARLVFRISGLDCAEEVAVLKREIGPLVGGDDKLGFDVLNAKMSIFGDGVSADSVKRAVARTGMSAKEWHADQPEDKSADLHRRRQVQFTTLSGLGVLTGFLVHVWLAGGLAEALGLFGGHGNQPMPWPEILAYALAIGLGARFVLGKAWFSARRLRPDINLLMVIAVTGAIGIGEWFEAATVTFLFALSLTLEAWSVGRARRAISALLDLTPSSVRIIEESGREREVAAAEVTVGTRFVVKPGERIPLDGVVIAGDSGVNQAPITGESVPVYKSEGETVYAGTINGDGALEVESSKAVEDTTLARIIRMVEEAQGRRAQAEQWVERFARVYTPTVIVLALGIFLLPPLLFGGDWSEWLYRSLVLLVIACPCALVISTPVSIVSALAASARQGVLIKGGVYIEQPARLKAIAFDKTGTLTRAEPTVTRVIPLNDHTEAQIIEQAAALEARSSHPLARAVVEYAQLNNIPVEPVADMQTLKGKGVVGSFRGEAVWLGSHRYLIEREQETLEVANLAETLERDGNTVVAIGNDRHVCGLLAIADSVRPGAAEALQALRRHGIEHLVMLTGDNRITAEAIAREVGIDEVHAELLPEDKVSAMTQIIDKYEVVAMVGDGVNDAPAMARASFGIAMGAIGSDAAIEAADIALMTDDLGKLPWLVGHSRRTLAIIRQNIAFSLMVKVVFVVATFAGYATLWGAIAADVGASLLVVANALRLLRPVQRQSVLSRTPVPD